MTHTEALSIVGVVAAAYEQSWRPSKMAIRLYCEILAVPELDFEATRSAVLDMLRSDRAFAPTAGQIYQAARERSREKFEQQALPRLVSAIIDAPENRGVNGVPDIDAVSRALANHPLVRLHGAHDRAQRLLWRAVDQDRARFGLPAPASTRLLQ